MLFPAAAMLPGTKEIMSMSGRCQHGRGLSEAPTYLDNSSEIGWFKDAIEPGIIFPQATLSIPRMKLDESSIFVNRYGEDPMESVHFAAKKESNTNVVE